jgi:glycerol-3-phosphate O-acyltransferase
MKVVIEKNVYAKRGVKITDAQQLLKKIQKKKKLFGSVVYEFDKPTLTTKSLKNRKRKTVIEPVTSFDQFYIGLRLKHRSNDIVVEIVELDSDENYIIGYEKNSTVHYIGTKDFYLWRMSGGKIDYNPWFIIHENGAIKKNPKSK